MEEMLIPGTRYLDRGGLFLPIFHADNSIVRWRALPLVSAPGSRLANTRPHAGRRGQEAGGHPASHVARWNRLHLVKQGGNGLNKRHPRHPRERKRCPCRDGGVGEIDLGFSMPIGASAIDTLLRQRPPTPSCRGLSPYCGENRKPGRHSTESLTSNPRVREQPRPKGDICWSLKVSEIKGPFGMRHQVANRWQRKVSGQ
jgi:hypothetical protein